MVQMAECIRRVVVVTRAAHRCFGCLGQFPAHTRMSAETNVEGGRIYTIHLCMECVRFMQRHPDWVLDDYGDFQEGCVVEARRERESERCVICLKVIDAVELKEFGHLCATCSKKLNIKFEKAYEEGKLSG